MHTKTGHNNKKNYCTSAWEHNYIYTGNEASAAIANVSSDRTCTMHVLTFSHNKLNCSRSPPPFSPSLSLSFSLSLLSPVIVDPENVYVHVLPFIAIAFETQIIRQQIIHNIVLWMACHLLYLYKWSMYYKFNAVCLHVYEINVWIMLLPRILFYHKYYYLSSHLNSQKLQYTTCVCLYNNSIDLEKN